MDLISAVFENREDLSRETIPFLQNGYRIISSNLAYEIKTEGFMGNYTISSKEKYYVLLQKD